MLTSEDKKWLEDMVYRVMTRFYQTVIAPKMSTKDDISELRQEVKKDIKRLDTITSDVATKVSSLEKSDVENIRQSRKETGRSRKKNHVDRRGID